MNPRDILEVADSLVAGVKEAEWRSAVSRAYYAAFHVARQLLLQCGFAVPRGDQAHGYLWLRVSNAGQADVQIAGNNLNHLRQIRNWADYDLDRPLDQDTALELVQTAEDIIHILETVAEEPAILARIIAAIKVYERDVLRQTTWTNRS